MEGNEVEEISLVDTSGSANAVDSTENVSDAERTTNSNYLEEELTESNQDSCVTLPSASSVKSTSETVEQEEVETIIHPLASYSGANKFRGRAVTFSKDEGTARTNNKNKPSYTTRATKSTPTERAPSVDDDKDVKLDYLLQKREKQFSKINTIKKEWEEDKERLNKQRNRNLWEAQNLLDLADFEKQREQRKKKEQADREKQKEADYKLILRDARRRELQEFNKEVDRKEKLRQQKLKELDVTYKQIHLGMKNKSEEDWMKNDMERTTRVEERKRGKEERSKLNKDTIGLPMEEFSKEKSKKEIEETQFTEWGNVYETKCREENLHLNRTVKEEIMINVLQNERDDEAGEEDKLRSKRKTNDHPKNQKSIQYSVSSTKRSVADTVLTRSRLHRQHLQ